MFKNTIKKFAAFGLVAALCAPCCFASAQMQEEREQSDSSEHREPSEETHSEAQQIYSLNELAMHIFRDIFGFGDAAASVNDFLRAPKTTDSN